MNYITKKMLYIMYLAGVFLSIAIACVMKKTMFDFGTSDGFLSQMLHFSNGTEVTSLYFIHLFRYIVAYPFFKTNHLEIAPIIHTLILSIVFFPPCYQLFQKQKEASHKTLLSKTAAFGFYTFFLPLCILVVSHRSLLCMIGVAYLYSICFLSKKSLYTSLLLLISLFFCNLSSGTVLVYIGTMIMFQANHQMKKFQD